MGPCSTICHQKSLEKGGRKNGSIYAQFGTIENRLALKPLNNGHEFGFLACVAGAAITVGRVCVFGRADTYLLSG